MFSARRDPTVVAMTHPTAAHTREVYAAATAGDMAPALEIMLDEFAIHNDVGAGPWHEVQGKAAVLAFWTRWMELFDGTFRQEITDAIGYDDRVVLLVHETGTAKGAVFDNRAIYLLELQNGRWASMRTIDMDPQGCIDFWTKVNVPNPSPTNA
jgi:hypothetical protein